uniref:Uncharacterized protein n=1 Tax=mine drainage metagenome TaxID=410659 RepID=E6QQ07_9ZZZZ
MAQVNSWAIFVYKLANLGHFWDTTLSGVVTERRHSKWQPSKNAAIIGG